MTRDSLDLQLRSIESLAARATSAHVRFALTVAEHKLRHALERMDGLDYTGGTKLAGHEENLLDASEEIPVEHPADQELPTVEIPPPPGPDGLGLDPILEPGHVPERGELLARLRGWQSGEMSSRAIQGWAEHIVDQTLLPDLPPENPDSVAVEVVLELSAMQTLPWNRDEIDALVAFLETAPSQSAKAWRRWFQHVARRGR